MSRLKNAHVVIINCIITGAVIYYIYGIRHRAYGEKLHSLVCFIGKKSFNLLKSGHVINVKEVKSFKTNSIIFGNVIRQTSVTSTPYK
ncbi:SWIM-type domain-containing protein, partial [Aphis craccivora]